MSVCVTLLVYITLKTCFFLASLPFSHQMNPPSVEPRVRPFAFNPANIQAPPDSVRPLNLSNARPKSSYPAHQNFTSSTTAFQPQKLWQNSKKQAKTNESNLIHLSSVNQKSPVSKRKRQEYKSSPQYIRPQPIHQSLNVDNHPQISNKQNKTKPPSPEVDILIQDIDDDNDDTEDLVDADMLLGGSKEDAKKTAITKEQNSRPRSQSPTLFDFDPLLESKTAISTIQGKLLFFAPVICKTCQLKYLYIHML